MNITTMMKVVHHEDLGSSAKILWLKLFERYGYESFSGHYEEMAEEVGSKRYTVRAQIWQLKDAGAIDVEPYYEGEKKGNSGQTFKLINPNKWR